MSTERRREVRWEPSGDSHIRVRFLLHGPLGSTQFLVRFATQPSGISSLDYHSVRPISHATKMDQCDVLHQGHCWYDGSGLQASELARLFFATGEDVVWEWLEDRYQSWLEAETA